MSDDTATDRTGAVDDDEREILTTTGAAALSSPNIASHSGNERGRSLGLIVMAASTAARNLRL